jgi:uncharacterized membrane protein
VKSGLQIFLEGKKYPTDLILIIACSVISAIGIFISPEGSAIRVILGLPMLIFLPGYALVAALWPARKGSKLKDSGFLNLLGGGLSNLERIILSVGLSIVLVPLFGMVLNYVSTITLGPILFSLLGFTLVCSSIAWYLRNIIPSNARLIISFATSPESVMPTGSFGEKVIAVILAASIISSTGAILYLVVNPAEEGPYTEFYLLDQNHMLENLPKNLTVNEIGTIYVGIVNHEKVLVNYTLIVSLSNSSVPMAYDNSSVITASASQDIAANITLNHDGMFEQEYEFSFPAPGRYRIEWQLLIEGQETNYNVHMWVNIN